MGRSKNEQERQVEEDLPAAGFWTPPPSPGELARFEPKA